MSLAAGTRLGVFEVVSTLGAGGMGEVYRARDTELKREVAIKALLEGVASDADRVARFEREAQLLASMNHPNIGSIFGIERREERLFLVLELVEGETLKERLDAGPMTLEEVLTIFRQIAKALEAAHAKGIVHRDLKPDNVKITPEGIVKVLDFGLAKPFIEEEPTSDVSKTKTAPSHMTIQGQIIGTPAYMSPEQTRGEALGKRTDIWSFGCCLYEALARRLPFNGRDYSEMMALVQKAQPDFDALPRFVPRNIRNLLRRCLEKDLQRRLHDIGDARLEIEDALESPDLGVDPDGMGPSIGALVFAVAVSLLVGLAVGGLLPESDVIPRPLRRFTIELPPTAPIALGSGPALAVDAAGRNIVYTSRRGGSTELRLRTMDQLVPTVIPNTVGATTPFFAPDDNGIGFFLDRKLHSHPLVGPPRPLADAPSPRGASWGPGGEILFSPGTVAGLDLVSSETSRSTALTTVREEGDEKSHRWPSVLPDGRSALFTNWKGDSFDIEWISLDSGERKLLVENGSYPRYVPTGHLLFARDEALWAATFDPERPDEVGEAVQVLDDLHMDSSTKAAFYDVSMEGTLVYVPRAEETSVELSGQLLHVNRVGEARVLLPTPRSYQAPRVSTSGRLMFTIMEVEGTHVWVWEPTRGSPRRVTFDGNNGVAIWSPDGLTATIGSARDGEAANLFMKAVDREVPAERLTESSQYQFPNSWSPDGEALVFTQLNELNFDLWIRWRTDGRDEPWLQTDKNESAAAISPNGEWIAYVSDKTGEGEVYVCRFPSQDDEVRISQGGGGEPVWSPDGTELYYRDEEWLLTVAAPDFRAPKRLFEAPFDEGAAPYANYDVTRENDGFIMVRSDEELSASRIIVVLEWFEELNRIVPTGR